MDSRAYILTHRLAGAVSQQARMDSAAALEEELTRLARAADVEHDKDSTGAGVRRVVRVTAEPRWVEERAASLHDDVILEPRVEFWPHFLAEGRPQPHMRPAVGDAEVSVSVRAAGRALANAAVTMMYANPKGESQLLAPQRTDADGRVTLRYDSEGRPLVIAAYPSSGYWSVYVRQPGHEVELDCPPLPRTGPLGWWHRVMGIEKYNPNGGEGVRIGLLGTGVSKHPCLPQVRRVDDKEDLDSHGTHVCGLIGARPIELGQFAGLAPGVEILSRRVFEKSGDDLIPADQGHLVQAIDAFSGLDGSEHHVDLINMSLGGRHSLGLADAVAGAFQRGTICVCSAGNTSQSVEYPAALESTIGVGALGQIGWGPENSTSAFMMPDRAVQPGYFGNEDLYLATFSCFGPRLACSAPGSGLISTVPPRHGVGAPYASMDGTSLSSPAVAATLAVVLSQSAEYRKLPRDERRAALAMQLFEKHCVDIGLDWVFQGSGLPRS